MLPAAEEALTAAQSIFKDAYSLQVSDVASMQQKMATVEITSRALTAADGRVQWLRYGLAVQQPQPRSSLAVCPKWSFAGNLVSTARTIERKVAQTVTAGRVTKDEMPLIYVSNPPRHGKSLLLDTLFKDGKVCVLNATYNSGNHVYAEEKSSAQGALRCLCHRLMHDLVFAGLHEHTWTHSPFATAENPMQLFEEIFGLLQDGAPAMLLICIDEISKLVDDAHCAWARDPARVEEAKSFWRGLFSLTRATQHSWVRVVMTGFTDSPEREISTSDVPCLPLGLSMITDPERELLASELVWAYAVENLEPFPGLLWTLMKSTPGLLGLWAHCVQLHYHTKGSCACSQEGESGVMANFTSAMRANDLGSMVGIPWVCVLRANAAANWPRIYQFLIEEDALSDETTRIARNAELATTLGKGVALSPFAVAVTVMALRGTQVSVGQDVFKWLDNALRACALHSAGCANDMPTSWRSTAQTQLQNTTHLLQDSLILRQDPRLAKGARALPEPSMNMPNVSVHNMGQPYEVFVLNALALRLECLRCSTCSPGSPTGRFVASLLLPPADGMLRRPQLFRGCGLTGRHHVDDSISVVVPSGDAHLFLARLCTQTASLLLPSSITSILRGAETDTSVQRSLHFDKRLPMDLGTLTFVYSSVAVATGRACPHTFPVIQIDNAKHSDCQVRLSFLSRAATTGRFDEICAKSTEKGISQMAADVLAVKNLAVQAATLKQAVLFAPSNATNPLCDVVAIIPCDHAAAAPSMVFFLWMEMRDRELSNFGSKLNQAVTNEFLLAPVAILLERDNIAVAGAVLMPVTRVSFQVQ